ncbi:Manganese catalase family protein [Rhodovastum atsumiense]|uniref:Manganese catalase family protein n=1 Tax=Rhodovastum atsumiense TaxID=504468 RepID=A0A5M6IWC4_9PROT|nr:manganese catalase family protein [Rhodovastum atsumiense]KAA5612624.1 manganese catalase family protein [Rhodovastum atsumiense]CAH2601275.1 Manganese catalase family protein [Rhodovastum atsumiense]
MFIHKPVLLHEVRVETPDPVFAEKLLEQFGGATGELTAALTYLTQSFHTEDPGIRDMLQDIGTEELGHLEVVAMLIEQHTKGGSERLRDAAYRSTLFAIRGPGAHLVDSKGSFWDARYVNEGGYVVRDLRANIAAEAGALATYEALIAMSPDDGSLAALRHLATREVAHTQMFMTALKSMNKLDDPLFGELKPDETVNVYYNMSSGNGADERGPWNSEPAFKYVADPLQNEMREHAGQAGGNAIRMQQTQPGGAKPSGSSSR